MPTAKKNAKSTAILPDSSLPTKSSTKVATQPTKSPTKAATHVSPVALLIDGENVIVPDLITHILAEAGKMGGVTIRQVYGNWAAPSMQAWKKESLEHYELEQMENSSGSNATDIALVIGAMDLFYHGVKHFCLVAGDSDYVPLVQRLKKGGCTVLVIGSPAASNALKNASSTFLSTDQLVLKTSSVSKTPSPASSQKLTSSQIKNLSTLLTNAYQVAIQQSESEWVNLGSLGTILRKQDSTFEATYGKKSLSTLIEQCTKFEVRERDIENGHQVNEMRLAKSAKNGHK